MSVEEAVVSNADKARPDSEGLPAGSDSAGSELRLISEIELTRKNRRSEGRGKVS